MNQPNPLSPVTDQEIERILAENEAGVGALLAAYEPIERAYFNAVQPPQGVTVSNNTSPR